MRYVEFLNWLLAFGPKLPAILAAIEIIVSTFTEQIEQIRVILGSETTLRSAAPTDEELALEARVMELALEGRSAGPLQRVLDFIRNNPELIQLLLIFLK